MAVQMSGKGVCSTDEMNESERENECNVESPTGRTSVNIALFEDAR